MRVIKLRNSSANTYDIQIYFVLFLARKRLSVMLNVLSCADPEGGGGAGGPDPPPEKSQNIGFSSNTGPDPLKNHCYQASIQCWAIIGTPAKRHLMAFCWRTDDDGPLIVVSYLP